MKNKLIFTTLMCLAGTAFGQNATIKSEIKGMGNGEIKIYYYEGDAPKNSEVKVVNDKFLWTGSLLQPQKITLMFPKRAVWLFAESGTMELNGNIDSLLKFLQKFESLPFLARINSLSINSPSSGWSADSNINAPGKIFVKQNPEIQ